MLHSDGLVPNVTCQTFGQVGPCDVPDFENSSITQNMFQNVSNLSTSAAGALVRELKCDLTESQT